MATHQTQHFNLDRLVQRLVDYCRIETPSGFEDAALPFLRSWLVEMGAVLIEQPISTGRTNLLALWGNPKIIFSTHLDTVPSYFPPEHLSE
ncbi:MAG: hypothetical protein ACO3D2_01910 [Holophagaceae bacterium]